VLLSAQLAAPMVSLQQQIKVLHSSHFLTLQETFHDECDSLATYISVFACHFHCKSCMICIEVSSGFTQAIRLKLILSVPFLKASDDAELAKVFAVVPLQLLQSLSRVGKSTILASYAQL
jgi:hypothetical protein